MLSIHIFFKAVKDSINLFFNAFYRKRFFFYRIKETKNFIVLNIAIHMSCVYNDSLNLTAPVASI